MPINSNATRRAFRRLLAAGALAVMAACSTDQILEVEDIDEALDVQAKSRYGNAASVFTESGGIARHVMETASAGMVGVNVGVPVPREPFGFGGWNESKFGVGDITGRSSIDFWTKSKKMTTKWNREAGTNWMS